GGASQSATINTAFGTPLQVTVKDSGGNPVSGLIVTFAAPLSGAGAILTTPPPTNAQGQTTVTATANSTAGGPYTVTATVAGVSTPASFSLTNLVGSPA